MTPTLSEQITGFTRYAREQRFHIGIQETLDSQKLADKINILDRKLLQQGLKSLLCTTATDWHRFDDLFDAYWKPVRRQNATKTTSGGKSRRQSALAEAARETRKGIFDIPDTSQLDGQGASDSNMSQAGASASETDQQKNFSQLADINELTRMQDLAEHLARRIRQRLLRRQRIDNKGKRVDMRRSIRQSLRYGGLPLSLSYRKRQRRIPRLVILLDVSRSMSVYSYLFLRFTRGILSAFKGAEAFAFHTRLINIGDTLRDSNRRVLDEKLGLISAGWDGGTRIDQSLQQFNRDYARNLLGSRSIVMILSDGYDTGKPQLLAEQLSRIKKRCRRLIWLNPLLGQQNYQPITQSMQAAMPYIDNFLPAHNLHSLAALESQLGGV